MRYLFFLTVIILNNFSTASPTLITGTVESALLSNQLVSLTRHNLEVKFCEMCNASLIILDKNTEFYEAGNPITFNQALELSINKKHSDIIVFFDRSSNKLKKIMFGKYPDNIDR